MNCGGRSAGIPITSFGEKTAAWQRYWTSRVTPVRIMARREHRDIAADTGNPGVYRYRPGAFPHTPGLVAAVYRSRQISLYINELGTCIDATCARSNNNRTDPDVVCARHYLTSARGLASTPGASGVRVKRRLASDRPNSVKGTKGESPRALNARLGGAAAAIERAAVRSMVHGAVRGGVSSGVRTGAVGSTAAGGAAVSNAQEERAAPPGGDCESIGLHSLRNGEPKGLAYACSRLADVRTLSFNRGE